MGNGDTDESRITAAAGTGPGQGETDSGQMSRPDLLKIWKDEWNKTAPIGQKSDEQKLFYHLFQYTYNDVMCKKNANRKLNFRYKKIFVGVIAIALAACCFYFVYAFLREYHTGDIFVKFVSAGVFLVLLMLVCEIISKWVDVKKYQETWSRHSRHVYLMEKEMLLFIYQLKPYDTSRREETFVLRVLEIWDDNQNRFCENMENKEKELMDVFDRVMNAQKSK